MATQPIPMRKVDFAHNEKGDMFTALDEAKQFVYAGDRDQYNADTLNIYNDSPKSDNGDGNQTTINPLLDKARILAEKGPVVKDSCSWIFEQPDFIAWQSSTVQKVDFTNNGFRPRADSCQPASQLLWISGNQGMGKTMLLAGIIDHLCPPSKRGVPRTPSNAAVAYFFCERNDKQPKNKEAASVLDGLYRLLRDEKGIKCDKSCRQAPSFNGHRSYALILMADVLIEMINSYGKPVYLIIDSLDECEEDEEWKLLLDRILEIKNKCSNVRWLISSCPGGGVQRWFESNCGDYRQIEMNARNLKAGVNAYIDKRLGDLDWIKADDVLFRKIRNQVRGKANGTFLWVHLICNELKEVDSSSVDHLLENAPRSLTLMMDRSTICKYVEEGYKYYEEFKKLRALSNEQIRGIEETTGKSIFNTLRQSIEKYRSAIGLSRIMKQDKKGSPYHLGMLRGNIGKAEACRELSHTHEKSVTEAQKRKHIEDAEKCISIALDLAVKTGDKQREIRTIMESAVLGARKALFETNCVNGQALESEFRSKLLCQLYSAHFTLQKRRDENSHFINGVRSANCWLKELDQAIEDFRRESTTS